MNIYYQWNIWSYMWIAAEEISKFLDIKIKEIIWLPEFNDVWENISKNSIWVLAIENSYMWSIHQNLYNFINYDYEIIAEFFLEIKHCLCSKEDDIKKIKKVYSQQPALLQCKNYLKKKKIEQINFIDTSLSAKHIKENDIKWAWAICSEKAANYYWLNILEKNIADQKWNTTRFIAIAKKNSKINYLKKSNKISIIFEAKDIPASLYKCLWAFATNNVNLTKIESIPSFKDSFSYYFWLDLNWSLKDENIKKSIKELKFFTKDIKILWNY